jgi:hypothetical protein
MYNHMNHDFLQDFERELAEERQRRHEEEDQMSGWNVVEIDQTPVDIGVSFFSFFMHYSLCVHHKICPSI